MLKIGAKEFFEEQFNLQYIHKKEAFIKLLKNKVYRI